ncbi:holo-ACP synthase [Xylocopilactobacillus apicola]|uniref:Holo-[acyl-carrier-protein] synthase n=1 Tax=Xylocopilactobacillus apicola TaxID=2932184 RepID=A0AAU9D0V6_9LACO|nr:holo-ACP synthase [Xylocopilactobacillus apicola]BDR58326.1 holo-[acyl-carrier-protein] synthase [Xylocopilactobacillus apicola]
MIYGIGVDITEKNRVYRLMKKFGEKFSERILTKEELEIFQTYQTVEKRVEFLGGRFSAKESYAKAFGTGLGSVGFQDLAILNQANGHPFFLYHPFKGVGYISISHTNELVMTEVILEEKDEI